MNCTVAKDLSILLSAMHKISRFSLMIVLRLVNLYLIEFTFEYEKNDITRILNSKRS